MISATPSGGALVPYERRELVPVESSGNSNETEEEKERLFFLEQGAFLYNQARKCVLASPANQMDLKIASLAASYPAA